MCAMVLHSLDLSTRESEARGFQVLDSLGYMTELCLSMRGRENEEMSWLGNWRGPFTYSSPGTFHKTAASHVTDNVLKVKTYFVTF